MNDSLCGDFINRLIENLPDKVVNGNSIKRLTGDISDRFESVAGGNGFYIDQISQKGLYYAGSITFGDAYFRPSSTKNKTYAMNGKNLFELGANVQNTNLQTYTISESLSTSFTLVHELIHSYYGLGHAASHDDMAEAARGAMMQTGIRDDAMPPLSRSSEFFNSALIKACSRVKL